MDSIFVDGKELKRFRDTGYFVSNDGEVYSSFSKRKLKLLKRWINDRHFYYYVDVYLNHVQKHVFIHRMVYEVWVGEIPNDMQVNHKDDNKINNSVSNLYVGTQKENIADCIRNGHREPFVESKQKQVVLYDNKYNTSITFKTVTDALSYLKKETGHTASNNCISQFEKSRKRKWFSERFKIIQLGSVTTNGDECSHVG